MKIINCDQNSKEWYEVRCGIPSASCFDKIVTSEGKPSKQRTKYLHQLAGEIVTKTPMETYQSDDMLRGKEFEAEAKQMYQLVTGKKIKEVGFCVANGYGASPDGFVDTAGLIEIKCCKMTTHISYLFKNVLPIAYFEQLQGQLLVTGRKYVDFMSYYPGLKPLIIRVKRDKKFLDALSKELKIFCKDLKLVVRKIK